MKDVEHEEKLKGKENNNMKVIHSSWFPFGNYSTINLFGILITKEKNLSKYTINHEAIHTAQMKEMLYVFFYLWYGIEYILIRLFHRKQSCAYHDVSFEEEAYYNEFNLSYLKSRKHYNWIKYVRIRSNH